MNHVVYLDVKAKEFEKLVEGSKMTLIRGAAGRKIPYGRVFKDDILYFINNNGEGKIKAKAKVLNVFNSEKMDKEQSINLVNSYKEKLNLSSVQEKRWAGKKYLVLVDVDDFEKIEPFEFNRDKFKNNMDDWLIIEGDLSEIRKN